MLPVQSFALVINEQFQLAPLAEDLEYLLATDGRWTFEKILEEKPNFVPLKAVASGSLLSVSEFWVRFDLSNQTGAAKTIMLANKISLLFKKDLYFYRNGDIKFYDLGNRYSRFVDRGFMNRFPTAKLELQPGTNTFYMHFRSPVGMTLSLWAKTPSQLAAGMVNDNMYLGFFFGIILVTALYNIALYIAYRRLRYLFLFRRCQWAWFDIGYGDGTGLW